MQLHDEPLRGYALFVEALAAIEENPQHWKQETWRCETGMCLAGWVVTLSDQADWAHQAIAGEGITVGAKNSMVRLDGAFLAAGTAAEALLGVDGRRCEAPYCDHDGGTAVECARGQMIDLFGANNTLHDLYVLGAKAYGVDEETLREAVAKARANANSYLVYLAKAGLIDPADALDDLLEAEADEYAALGHA